ncbi:thioredoxin family protein [Streptomyces bambusae]|uniref:thioredoxin family protein n=1 Tax=Streptomyces bambusae TaxID=1550616 RepID=UPI001CFD393F|nr:thioredoxin family protein [Streptomyces bambusae]MCB5165861.1 thioredoxin family protein [Streptomyces bambusae]
MAAHRRPNTSRISGLVRFSAVSLTVATAALATACGAADTKNEDAQRVSAASVPDVPAAQTPDGGEAEPTADPAASASATPAAKASASAPAAAAPADRPARSAAAPAAKSAAKPSAAPRPAKPAAKPAVTPTKSGGGSASGDSGFVAGYPASDAKQAVKAAVAAAKADGKRVLVDFGANWCGNCKAADKVFGTSAVGKLLDASYHVVKVDIGSQNSGAFDLLRSYCSGEGAYKMPVLVVLDGNGNVVTETHSTGNPSLTTDGLSAFLRKWA